MLKAYFNYPTGRTTIHRNSKCGSIQVMNKPNQRVCRIDTHSVSIELQKFNDKEYKFQSTASLNDMWLEIDFQDETFEMAVLHHIHRVLGKQYKRFRDGKPVTHC